MSQRGKNQTLPDFFLPDFCQAQAVFLLILITELFVLVMVLAASGIRGFAWGYLALVSLFALWVVLASAGLLCWLRHRLAQLSLAKVVIAIYLLIMLMTLLASLGADWVLAGAKLAPFHIDSAGLLRNLIISAIMTGLVLRYLYLQSKLRKHEQAELHSRIQALQSRIRPHFLFNSMNIIASLIESEPETAERVVEDLSELFRASLKEGTEAPVPIGREVALCQRYIGIEQLRLGERLKVNWTQEDLPSDATIPMLTLQPLVENAIYHGIQPLQEGGTIGLLLQYQEDRIHITISNPLNRSSDKGSEGNHIALDNITNRLKAFYGDSAKLQTHESGDVFVTQLSYPWREQDA